MSDLLIILNAILLLSVLICGGIMLHAGAQYSWTTGLPDQGNYEQRILRLIIILVAIGLVASALNLFLV